MSIEGKLFILFLLVLLYILGIALFKHVLKKLGVKPLVIPLRKDKKWEGKVNPIYKILKLSFVEGWLISKYSLEYKKYEPFLSDLFSPFPLELNVYKYHKQSYQVTIYKDIEPLPDNIEEAYERKALVYYKKELEKESAKFKQNEKIKNLNKIFNENYEK